MKVRENTKRTKRKKNGELFYRSCHCTVDFENYNVILLETLVYDINGKNKLSLKHTPEGCPKQCAIVADNAKIRYDKITLESPI